MNSADKIYLASDYLVDKHNEAQGYPRVRLDFELKDEMELEVIINEIELKLPRWVCFYEVDGKKIFKIKDRNMNDISIACFLVLTK